MCGTLCVCRSFFGLSLEYEMLTKGSCDYIHVVIYVHIWRKKDLLTNSVNPYVKERMQRNKMDREPSEQVGPIPKKQKKALGGFNMGHKSTLL